MMIVILEQKAMRKTGVGPIASSVGSGIVPSDHS
jgi:hypothetical protein